MGTAIACAERLPPARADRQPDPALPLSRSAGLFFAASLCCAVPGLTKFRQINRHDPETTELRGWVSRGYSDNRNTSELRSATAGAQCSAPADAEGDADEEDTCCLSCGCDHYRCSRRHSVAGGCSLLWMRGWRRCRRWFRCGRHRRQRNREFRAGTSLRRTRTVRCCGSTWLCGVLGLWGAAARTAMLLDAPAPL